MTIVDTGIIVTRKRVELVTVLIPRNRTVEAFNEISHQLRDGEYQSIRGRPVTVDSEKFYEMVWIKISEVGYGSISREAFDDMTNYLDSIEDR